MRILIADDDDLALDVLESTLVESGHVVTTARDGREALAVFEQGLHRLVISDWQMPGLDGLELCRRIRAGGTNGYTYFILVTAREGQDDVVEGLSAGADDFVSKPFHPGELRMRVQAGERILAMETRDVAIFALAKLAESRDPETGEHLQRMRNYARVLAEHLRSHGTSDEEFVRLIYLTSPLHDIGKVGIPDCVLLKPGRLSDREFDIMKTHAAIGAETLAAAERQYPDIAYLKMAREIAQTHHERFNGTGYPAGLVGEGIPLCGRIVALADVYDALTSKRVYKDAFTHDVARSMIVDEAGKHFDPLVVDAFVQQEAQFMEIRERYSEMPPAARGDGGTITARVGSIETPAECVGASG